MGKVQINGKVALKRIGMLKPTKLSMNLKVTSCIGQCSQLVSQP